MTTKPKATGNLATTTIAERPLGTSGALRVEISPFRGQHYIGLRRFYRDDSGELRPGKGGLSVRAENIPWLRLQLERAERAALEAGLLDEEAYETAGLPLPEALTR